MKKAKKRTKAQRSAAAKLAWERRRAAQNIRTIVTADPVPMQQYDVSLESGRAEHVSVTFALANGYTTLHRELMEAYEQSAFGKGKERHANGRPFDRQPIMEIGRMVGPGYTAGQAQKKAQEALGMLSRGQGIAALAEIHGAIVYLAATAALIRENGVEVTPEG